MPLGLLYLGTPAFFRRAGGSAVAPGFVVSPRPPGACFKGVCTRLGGLPIFFAYYGYQKLCYL